ncbi:hypothetical protein L9F63_010512 [Diploptera punctata]|uniref:CHK kinase-like domain-containing protein n=1 Tax=Diploptera punctata TaxID=6984 RepID=A0AAD8AGZ6_DIPPU|nr:hypothetical protein L9F63_010512 [Diploptera punctata]
MAENGEIKSSDRVKEIQETLVSQVPLYLKQISEHRNKELRVSKCKVDLVSRSDLAFHGASVLYSAVLELEEQVNDKVNVTRRQYDLIVKAKPSLAIVRLIQNSDDQFYNEAIFYSDIVPLLLDICSDVACGDLIGRNLTTAYDMFTKCLYASYEGETDLVALEDLRSSGYKIGGNKDIMVMDYSHILLGVKNLAIFHALSYGAKEKNPKLFEQKVMDTVKDSRKFLEVKDYSKQITVAYLIYLRHTTSLLLDKFVEKEESANLYTEQISKLRDVILDVEHFDKFIKYLLTPKEPLAVLCHGDFNMNNMMFKYDSDNQPVGIKFLDFQTIHYCSPMIDLSFFLFMNTTAENRAEHWEEMFSMYHSTLLSALSEFTNTSEQDLSSRYSLKIFQEELAKYCSYGYIIATTFIISYSCRPKDGDPFQDMDENKFIEDIYADLKRKFVIKDEVIDRLFSLVKDVLQKMNI